MPQRKAARVLPEPVGAQIRVLAPREIASQPAAWAGVGASKEDSNQRRTEMLNGASGSPFALFFVLVVNPPILRWERISLFRSRHPLDLGTAPAEPRLVDRVGGELLDRAKDRRQ